MAIALLALAILLISAVTVLGQHQPTCAESVSGQALIDNTTCRPDAQKAFDIWGDNLGTYLQAAEARSLINQKRLTTKQTTTIGLYSCVVAVKGGDVVAFSMQLMMANIAPLTIVEIRSLWGGAMRKLCPKVTAQSSSGA